SGPGLRNSGPPEGGSDSLERVRIARTAVTWGGVSHIPSSLFGAGRLCARPSSRVRGRVALTGRLGGVNVGGDRVEFLILGPLEVRADGQSIRVVGPRQRKLLALLLLNLNRVVPFERLVDELW